MQCTYASIGSVFSSKWKDLHTWNNCSLVLPILESYCLNICCKPSQSVFISLSNSYHNLASPTKVKQNICTFTWSWKLCVSIESFVLNKCASASSSSLPAYLGLNWDQFNYGFWGTPGTIGALGRKGLCWGGFCHWLSSGTLPWAWFWFWLGFWLGFWFGFLFAFLFIARPSLSAFFDDCLIYFVIFFLLNVFFIIYILS